jgi:hypothetical protein
MKYFRWTHESSDLSGNLPGTLTLNLEQKTIWKLIEGSLVEGWNSNTVAYFSDDVSYIDYPFTVPELPVYSAQLKGIVKNYIGEDVQFLPIKVIEKQSGRELTGYSVANYLRIIDCLDRDFSTYQLWTKENLLYWEKRPQILGKFRDVKKAAIKASKVDDAPLFRLWGWETMIIIREDIKTRIEQANIKGCLFTDLDLLE